MKSKKTFLVYLVEMILPEGLNHEWKYEKKAQYLVLGIIITLSIIVLGGIVIFNIGR